MTNLLKEADDLNDILLSIEDLTASVDAIRETHAAAPGMTDALLTTLSMAMNGLSMSVDDLAVKAKRVTEGGTLKVAYGAAKANRVKMLDDCALIRSPDCNAIEQSNSSPSRARARATGG